MGRDSKGRFLKGHKENKKDFTLEMARHIANEELHRIAVLICNGETEELEKAIVEGKLSEYFSPLSCMLIKKSMVGDTQAMKFMLEMVLGKPKQQIEHSGGIKQRQEIDIENLSDEEVDQLLAIHNKCQS